MPVEVRVISDDVLSRSSAQGRNDQKAEFPEEDHGDDNVEGFLNLTSTLVDEELLGLREGWMCRLLKKLTHSIGYIALAGLGYASRERSRAFSNTISHS